MNRIPNEPRLRLLPRLLAGIFALHAVVAAAQTTAPAKPAEKPSDKKPAPTTAQTPAPATDGPVQQVEIVAEKPTNRIDRQVYDVKSDISTSNSSAADALNNVPSVQVDPDGSVRLRGNQNVTILLDGKPSAMLQGENRGAALNAMPADFIESVEVVNNPGAEFGNEGGGGPLLNLISRRVRRPGGFGALVGNYGTAGRYNGGLNGSYSTGAASIDTFLNYRHDGRGSHAVTERERIDPVSHAVFPSSTVTDTHGLNGNLNFATNFRYNILKEDRTGGSINYNHGGRDSHSLSHYLDYDANGALLNEQWRDSAGSGTSTSRSASVFYEHKFEGGDDHTLKGDLRVSDSKNPSDSVTRRSFLVSPVPLRDEISTLRRVPDNRISDFTLDYTRRFGEGFVAAGMKVIDTRQDFDTQYGVTDPDTGVEQLNANLSNAFSVDERISAAYGTYEYKLDPKWSVKAGLRAERTELELHQLTSHIDSSNSYSDALPSAYVSYQQDKTTAIRFAYARRLHRPNAGDLNPYVSYVSPTDRSSGNPLLKPSHSNSFELSYDTTWYGVKTDLRLFARNEDDVVTSRQLLIKDENGQDVVLSTKENYGTNKSRGLEFVFNGKPIPALTLNMSGNWRHAEQTQFPGPGIPATLTGSSLSGRMRANYQLNPDNQLQLMVFGQGKQLTGQGYRDPSWQANMTWQHKLSPTLTLLVNATDVFNTNKIASHTDTDMLRQSSSVHSDGRIVYIGFRYQLGGVTSNARLDQMRQQYRDGMMRGGQGGPGGPGGPGPGGPGGT